MAEEKNYQEAYEKEHIKTADLAERVAVLEAKNEELNFKLSRIKNNPLWKASAPLRRGMHFVIRQRDRLKNCGSIRGVLAKLDYKKIERKAMARYGTESFPDEARAKEERETVFDRMIKISILVPLYNTPEPFLRDMITSVLNQTYQNWELCLADGSDAEHGEVGRICREYLEKDSRIVYQKLLKNEGISGNTNECLKLATGEYIGLFDHDDILHPSTLYEYVKAVNEQDADYIYCDETTFKNGDINKMLTMHFKPDYAVDNLRANNYICHFSVFAKRLLEGEELFRSRFDGSQDHDMILRMTDRAKHIVHIPKLLYYWRCHEGSVASGIDAKPYVVAAAKGAVADHLRRHGFTHFQITSTRAFETIFKIRYEIIGDPMISIVIPNKDHAADLKRCITSILEKSTYENYEIVIVENGSETKEIFEYYTSLKEYDNIRVVTYEKPEGQNGFNYSAVNNFGVKQTKGDYILLLNNDTEPDCHYIGEMIKAIERSPKIFSVSSKMIQMYHPDRLDDAGNYYCALGWAYARGKGKNIHTYEKEEKIFASCAGAAIYRKKIFDELGIFSMCDNIFTMKICCSEGISQKQMYAHSEIIMLHLAFVFTGNILNFFFPSIGIMR